jgi:hypothetical protein
LVPGWLKDSTISQGGASTIPSPDTVNDQPDTDDTPDANDAARRAALERLAARLFDRDLLARVDEDGWGLEPDASEQSRPDTDAAPAADEEERARALQLEAQDLAADPADRAEIAELRADLDDPLG